jgi:hypothetical protein
MKAEELRMLTRDPKTIEPVPGKEKETVTLQARAGEEDACRCKEASEMTPRQLLRLMISDLAFWKKARKE